MLGYSDRINHAFTYLAKHYRPWEAERGSHQFFAQPANVAMILARHQADETTLVASIIHHLFEAAPQTKQGKIKEELGDKFGAVITAIAADAAIPRLDHHGEPFPARFRRREIFRQLATIEPRGLDIRAADAIHQCGSAIAVVERLGVEYLEPDRGATPLEVAVWYDDVLDALSRRLDWPSRAMGEELRILSRRLRPMVGGG